MRVIKAILSGAWAAIVAAHRPYIKAMAGQADCIRLHKQIRADMEQATARIARKQ